MPKPKPPPFEPNTPAQQSITKQPVTVQPKVHFNWEDWLSYLQDVEGSDAEKRELMEMVWNIVLAFVDMHWEVDFDPQSCEQNVDLFAGLRAAVLQLENDKQKEEV